MKFSWEDFLFGGYTRSTSEPSALPLRVTAVVRFALCLEHLFYFCFLLHVELFFIFLTIVRSLDFARDDQREGLAIRIAFFLLMKTVTLSERSESNGYNLGEVKY